MKSVSPGLRSVLTQAIATGDVNQCCGVLRRIFSETVVEGGPRSSAPLTRRVDVLSQFADGPHSTPLGDLSSIRDDIGKVVDLGKVCLKTDPNLVKPTTISVLCHSAQRTNRWQDALHLSAFLPSAPPPIFLSSLLDPGNTAHILRHCRAREWDVDITNGIRRLSSVYGSWSAALLLAREGERQFAMGESFSAAVLIPHLANSGKEEEAKTIFTTAVAQGSFTSAPLVAQLISQTAELGRWEMSLSMLKTLGATQETSQLLPTSADFFRRIIDASPHWSAALYVFHLARTTEVRPDSRMVSIVIGLCDAAGVWSEATKIYDLAVKEGFMESLTLESTYQSLVRSFAAERQWEKALEALTWMTKAGDASTAAGKCELVEMCQEAGQWEAALAVGVELFEHHPELLSEKTSLSLLLACASGGRWETAFSIYKKQREDIRLSPHPLAVCAVLQSCITAERWAEALRVLSIAREDQTTTVLPPMAHRLAMKACVQSGRWSSVMQLLQTMKEDGLPHDNHSQRLGMWAAAIEGQWELSLSHLKHIPMQNRTLQDRMLIRGATRYVGPSASSIALRYLQSK